MIGHSVEVGFHKKRKQRGPVYSHLRPHSLCSPDVLPEWRVVEHSVEVWRRQLRGADGRRVLVEQRLRLVEKGTERPNRTKKVAP